MLNLFKAWTDPFLKWDPKDFNGLSVIRVPASEIYTPDIVLFNVNIFLLIHIVSSI